MAIYHLHAQIIGRGEGRSAVASAAYRHCARMEIEAEARVADYSNKKGLAHSEFALPEAAPAWLRTLIDGRDAAGASAALWNAVEIFEKRADAQFMREMDLALPVELTREQNIELVRAFVSEQILPRGMVADWAYHDSPGNPHIHLMTTLRPLTEEAFGPKRIAVLDENGNPLRIKSKLHPRGKIVYRLWAGDDQTLNEWREAWAALQNLHLARQGLDIRVDHRSFEERGLDLLPTSKIGVGATHIAREAEAREREVELDRLRLFEDQRQESAKRIVRRPEIILDMIARERSVFDERDLAKLVHRYVDDPGTFANVMARLMTSPELVRLLRETLDFETGERMPEKLATRTMIRTEADMARQALHLSGEETFAISNDALAVTFHEHAYLHDEQRAAVEYVTGASRIVAIVGLAGAGKTTALKAAREAWEREGFRVVGGALAGKAAEGLEKEAAIPARTLASWELRWGRGTDLLDAKTVFVMDEAGMVASRQMALFVNSVARSGAKLVLVGDGEQLQPIEAGAAFRAIHDRVGYVVLENVRRQKQDWMRKASVDFARGRTGDAINAYRARGKVLASQTKAEAIKMLIADWNRDFDPVKSSIILAHLRRDVRTLNEQARAALIERNLIGEGFQFQTEQGARYFAGGDQVVFLRNEISLGVKNGMIGRVAEAKLGRIVVEIGDDKRRVEIAQAFYRAVDHGYATTIHKSQGATVDRVKVLASLSLDKHLSYVAMTRHREDVALYYGRRSFEKAGGLIPLLSRRNAKETTLDYAGSREYLDALRYAINRGLHAFRVARALLDDQLRLIARAREKVARLGVKLAAFASSVSLRPVEQALALNASRSSILRPASTVNAPTYVVEPLLRGVTLWVRSITEIVKENALSETSVQLQWREVSDRFAQIYQDPHAAANVMKIEAVVEAPDRHRAVLDRLAVNPETFGELRGNVGLFASKAQKQERQMAIEGGAALRAEIERYIRLRSEASNRLEIKETEARQRASIDIPALSQSAIVVMERVRDAIDRNDLPGALGFALADRMVKAEIDRLNVALGHRFGERALLGLDAQKIEGPAYKALAANMPAADKMKLAEAWPTLRAAQQLAAHERSVQAIKQAETAKLVQRPTLKPGS
ncbi:Ti-type conjugative transfer relaxase TraA [Mesorhizobium sp. BH1-1-4]|uniref:Ti-type conjugative transfer relaxase TraA n=1 Tax=Mesorhizobium sp. BH1-1-4 TaxID=2876662 RepID=UPI001CD10AE0|nr:Ti-type conjugative transfer relaxase TraA [Mesorhizobium sp. BH1-1-4]MBZ9994089.1 Ti-type conjugative transfer relaxase TraA [Mesorhizobium sp. BH1-1-4]